MGNGGTVECGLGLASIWATVQAFLVIPFEVPQDENPGYYNFTIFVKLSSSGIKVDTVDFSVKVEYYADFTIDVVSSESVGDPGFTHALPVTIFNNANADEEITFDVEGLPPGWTYWVASYSMIPS